MSQLRSYECPDKVDSMAWAKHSSSVITAAVNKSSVKQAALDILWKAVDSSVIKKAW